MTKRELIENVASKTGVSIKDTSVVVEALIAEVKRNVNKGNTISIRNFGSFELRERAARKGRNIHSNTIVQIPARKVAYFKVSDNFFE